MNMRVTCLLATALTAILLLQGAIGAGDKKAKEPEKKKTAPFEPIVVNGELINADLKDKVIGQSFCKTFTFKMEKGRAYQIEMSSQAFRSYLRLENSEGQQLAAAVDQGNQRAVINYDPAKTEDFQIIATTLNGGATGKFTLIVKDATGYSILNVNDKLNQNDQAYKPAGGKKHKMFLVNLEAGKTYQIDMRSAAFDSYLYLESPDGKVLAQDDDGGGYPSARIIHKATQTGKYRIATTHFGGGGNLGDFTLSVRQTDGAPPVPRKDGDIKDGAKR